MTVPENQFPLGYFYIVSKMNELVIDIREPENAAVCFLQCQSRYFINKVIIGRFQDCYGSQKTCISRKR